MHKNGLTGNISLISEFMASQPEKKNTAINILPNISRSKRSQTMKFGHSLDPFLKNPN